MSQPKGKAEVLQKGRALERLVVQYGPPSLLKPNPYNPNRQDPHEFELLQRSMREDGFTQPIVAVQVDEEIAADPQFAGKGYRAGDIVIVDGEHRWRAAQELGLKEIPYCITPMTPSQMRVATLRHNRARGSEDIQLSAEVLRDLQKLGSLEWAQDSLMLDDAEVNKLLNDVPAPEALAAEQHSPAWDPTKNVEGAGGGDLHPSVAAAQSLRVQEQKIAAAKTVEERQAAVRDSDIYRLTLVFSGEEGRTVKAVLGEHPAQALLKLCQDQLAAAPRNE